MPAHVKVQISCLDQDLVVSVRDDGIGFDSGDRFPGMGLMNIQARTTKLGGQLDITSESGQGTQILLKIPIACMESKERE